MRVRVILALVGAAVLAAATFLAIDRGGILSTQRLGPQDGHDLSPVALDRVTLGVEAPDFSLRALDGTVVTLSDFRGREPVVLAFYRGHW